MSRRLETTASQLLPGELLGVTLATVVPPTSDWDDCLETLAAAALEPAGAGHAPTTASSLRAMAEAHGWATVSEGARGLPPAERAWWFAGWAERVMGGHGSETGKSLVEGAVYTPRRVANALAEAVFATAVRLPESILDPACGAGSLLLAVLEGLMARGLTAGDACRRLVGLDASPLAVAACRATLALACDDPGPGPNLAVTDALGPLGAVCAALGASSLPTVATCPGEGGLECERAQEGAHVGLERVEAVVANPPYRRAARRGAAALRRRFVTPHGAFDLYVPFVERCVELLAPGGVAALLTSNKYMAAEYGRVLRPWLRRETRLRLLLDLTEDRPFAELIDPVITVLQRRPCASRPWFIARARRAVSDLPATVGRLSSGGELPEEAGAVEAERVSAWPWPGDGPWTLRRLGDPRDVLNQLTRDFPKLGDLVELRTGVMGFDYRAVLAAVQEAPPEAGVTGARVLTTSLVRRWSSLWGQKTVRLGGALWRHPALARRPESISSSTWSWFSQPKLVVGGIGRELCAFADLDGLYAPLVAVHGAACPPPLALALAAYLGSAAARWLFDAQHGDARIPRGSRRFGVAMLKRLPVPAPAPALVAALAELGLAAHESPDASAVANAVDAAVDALFGARDWPWRRHEPGAAPSRPARPTGTQR